MAVLNLKYVRFGLRDPDSEDPWDICNIYLAGIQMDFEVFTMVPMWVLVHPKDGGVGRWVAILLLALPLRTRL